MSERVQHALNALLEAVRVLDHERDFARALGQLDVHVRSAIHALGGAKRMYAQCEHEYDPSLGDWCTRCYMSRADAGERAEGRSDD